MNLATPHSCRPDCRGPGRRFGGGQFSRIVPARRCRAPERMWKPPPSRRDGRCATSSPTIPSSTGILSISAKRSASPALPSAKPAAGPVVALSFPQGRHRRQLDRDRERPPRRYCCLGRSRALARGGAAPCRRRTSRRGDLSVTLNVPAQPENGDKLVFVVETADGRLRMASEAFRIVPLTASDHGDRDAVRRTGRSARRSAATMASSIR